MGVLGDGLNVFLFYGYCIGVFPFLIVFFMLLVFIGVDVVQKLKKPIVCGKLWGWEFS